MPTVNPTTSVTLTNPHDSTKSATFEIGVHVDGNRMPAEAGTVELVRFTNSLLNLLGIAREIVEPTESDDPDRFDDFVAASDECESALNDITPGGFYWHWYDSDFYLSAPDDRVGFEIERIETDAVIVAEGDGDFYPDAVDTLWSITVCSVDEDGDFADSLGTFAATWAGGQACYVNLFGAFYDSGQDIGLRTNAYTIANGTEALHIGDPAEDRSAQMAQARLIEWLQDYADGVESDWNHDAPHYGFPS